MENKEEINNIEKTFLTLIDLQKKKIDEKSKILNNYNKEYKHFDFKFSKDGEFLTKENNIDKDIQFIKIKQDFFNEIKELNALLYIKNQF